MEAMDLSPRSTGRMAVALLVIGLLASSVFVTMEPGKYRTLTFILLAFFAFRVLLGRFAQSGSR